MKLFSCTRVCLAVVLATLASTSLAVAETQAITGEIKKILGPDDLHLDPDSVVVAVSVYGDEDREVNGVLFQTDKTNDDTVGLVEKDDVRVDLKSTHFINGWAAAPAFTGGVGNSASNLAEIMSDIRWSAAPSPVTMDVSGLKEGGIYEIQILVNEGGDRDRHWDIAVNDELAVDDFTSEGTNVGDDVYAADNSFVYKGEFEANDDGQLNVVMQQHIGGQPQMGGDNNPILQAFIVHEINTSDDDPNVQAGAKAKFGQVASTPPTPLDVRVRNSGVTNVLAISGVTITGADAAHFTVAEFPASIPPDEAGFIKVVFDAKGRTGAFTANLNIASNDQTEAVNTIILEASVINRLGPASHLTLDDAAGSEEAKDASGNDANADVETVAGSATLGGAGLAGGTSLKVAGGGQLRIPGGDFDLFDSFSVSMWVKLDALGADPQTLFGKGDTDTPSFALLAVGDALWWLNVEAGESPEIVASAVLTAGAVHHVAVAYNNAEGARKVTIFVDGTLVAELDDPLQINDSTSFPFQVGAYNGVLPLGGVVDDVQIYQRALSSDEVSQILANPGLGLPIGENVDVDSDGDGLIDSREAELGTNPLKTDTDGDGLDDLAEVDTHGTDPTKADSDDDGFNDPVEILVGSNPLDAADTPIKGDILAAYWDFNDNGDAANVASTVGGHVGALGGDAAFTADGGGRSGLAGDRAMDFGSGGDTSSMSADGTFLNETAAIDQMTVVFWQRLRSIVNMTTFKARSPSSSGTERGWSVHTPWSDRTIYFDTAGCCDGATQRINRAPTGLDFLEWNHFAFVKNGSTKQIWVNGELLLEGRNTSVLPTDFTEIWLGAGIDGAESLDGMLDDFAIYRIALNEAQIGKLAAGARPDSNLSFTDTDGDGFDDDVERSLFGDLSQSPDSDKDSDGLSNSREIDETKTDPNVADTDGDTLSDGEELAANPATDPLRSDTDNDGLSDGQEKAAGTNPTLRDTDGDQFGDGFEVAEGYDPLDPGSPDVGGGGPVPISLETGAFTSAAELDFQGNFVYAVNVRGPGGLTVGDANFTNDDETAGLDYIAQNEILEWAPLNELADDPDTNALEQVLNSIRWSDRGNDPTGLTFTFSNLAPGNYKVQLLFAEKCCARGFDVSINGDLIADDFSPRPLQAAMGGDAAAGAFIAYTFPSSADTLVINLDGVDLADASLSDGNAIISGITIENIGSAGGSVQIDPAGITAVAGSTYDFADPELFNVSNLLDGLTNEGNQDAHQGTHWIALEGTFTETVTFDLGGTYDLTRMNILNTSNTGWNDSETDHFTVATSVDGGGTFSAPSGPIALQDFSEGFQSVPLIQSGVTHVQLVVTNDDADDQGTNDVRVGLNEVQFFHAVAAPSIPLEGLVGLWRFEGNTVDSSGNGNDGTLVDGAALAGDTPSGGGQSLQVDGGTQHVLVPDSDSLDITDAITIAAWVKPVGDVEWDGILAKSPSDGSNPNHAGNYELRIENGTRGIHFLHQQGGDNDTAFYQSSVAIVPGGEWSHIAVTGVKGGDLNYYINGQLVDTWATPLADTFGATNSNPLYIGSRADLFTTMNGFLDDVALFNRALGADEIASIMNGNFFAGGGGGNGGGGEQPGANTGPVITVLSGPDSIGLSFEGVAGKTYSIEYSQDLQNWQVLQTGLQGQINFEDNDAARQGRPAGYYRGVQD